MSRKGTTRLPRIAPTVFIANSATGTLSGVGRSSSRSAEDAGNAMPNAIVTGSTTKNDEPKRARSVSIGLPGVGTWPATSTKTRPSRASAAASDLAGREEPERVPDPRPEDCEQHRPECDPEEEHREDRREDVGRVARSGGEQPGPCDLVAEGRQAGDEGQGQCKTRRRRAAGRDGRVGGRLFDRSIG